ncbi:MAG: carboxypeptidase regulatory-like domain-containing protein [Acidobacteriota bacterium]
MGKMRLTLFLFCTLLLVSTGSLLGQIPQGQVLGTVFDATGAVVPGASVVLLDEQKGTTQTTLTNDSGVYTFSYLNSGVYTVTVEMPGFKKAVYSGNQVQVGEKKRVDVRLEVGEVTNTVEVTGAAAAISTDTAVVGAIVSQKEVIGMPLNGREFSQLAALMPGVRVTGRYGGALITDFAAAVTVGGTASSKNSYSVDGVDNTFNIWNGPAMNPSVDAVQEFRIDKSQFAAEYGRGGAQIQLVTKGGTNRFHGAAWDFARNYAMNAGNYTTHKQDTLKRHQFGANIGGPIIQNKAFFFFNFEAQRERSSVQPLGSVFTDKMRGGDLSELLPTKVVKDPTTGQPFPNNVIPAARLAPVALAYMEAMMGRANMPGIVNNFVRPFTTSRDWEQYIGRVDYRVSEKDNLFGRFNIQPRIGEAAPLAATSLNHREDMNFYNMGVGWDRSWTNNLVTETRFGFHRENLLLESNLPDKLPTTKIKGFGTTPIPDTRMPVVNITDFSGFHMWGFPLGFVQNSYEIAQNLSWFKGNHLIKAGFTGRAQDMLKEKGPEYQMSLTFNGSATGTGVGDYLLGLPYSVSQNLAHVLSGQEYGDYVGYVQDDWKITSNLTLNLGLRYELNSLPSEIRDRFSTFDTVSKKIVIAGSTLDQEATNQYLYNGYKDKIVFASTTNLPEHTLVFGDHNNLSPRFGFAWRPFSNTRTVVRGGYGIFYLLEDGNTAFNNTYVPVYGGSLSTDKTLNPNLTMADPFGGGALGAVPAPSVNYRDPYMRTPYLQQFTLGVQHQLPHDFIGEVTFQDQNSLKTEVGYDLNQAPMGPGTVASRRPYQDYSSITGTFHTGHSRYDALEFMVRKNATNYTFQWSHTWAKNMTQSGPYYWAKDIWNGPGGYVPHLDKMHFLVNLPFGKGMRWMNQGGVVDAILGGWTVSGIAILHQSGSPFTVTYNGDTANVGIFTVRAKRVGNGKLDNPTMAKWFDTTAFTTPDAGTFGDAGTGILFGPPARYFDAAVYKSFRIREEMKLQFRSEFFNFFNHPNLASPRTGVNSSNFGQILTKNLDPRTVQLALRLDF